MGLIKRHPILITLLIVALAGVAVLGATATAVWRAAHTDDARRHDHADLVAVLGAAQYSGRPSPTLLSRLEHAAALYQNGFAERVVVLGGGQPGDITTEGEAGRQWLLDAGLPEDAVFAEPVGSSTVDSLRGLASFMRQRGLRSVFLVSDPWHNLRIRKMGTDLGLSVYVSATGHSAAKSQWTRLSGYSRETFAYLYYRIFGR